MIKEKDNTKSVSNTITLRVGAAELRKRYIDKFSPATIRTIVNVAFVFTWELDLKNKTLINIWKH